MSGKHYLLVVLPDGKSAVRREYFELLSPDETITEAVGRWIECHPDMIDRVRNRDRTAERIRSEVLELRLCHPSSWYREQAGKEGRTYPSPPVGAGKVRRGR